MNKKIIGIIALTCFAVTIALYLFMKTEAVLPPANTSTNNTNTRPYSTPTNSEDQSPQLRECITRANNSEAQQALIDQAIDNCYRQYGN